MNKNEIITLSSDEENDFVHQPKLKKLCTVVTKKEMTQRDIVKTEENKVIKSENVQVEKSCTYEDTRNKNGIKRKKRIGVTKSPEVVDLEESFDKIPAIEFVIPAEKKLNHSNGDIDNALPKNNFHISEGNEDTAEKISDAENKESSAFIEKKDTLQQNIVNKLINTISKEIKEKQTDCGPQFFNEFVEFCGTFESNPNDREKLMKKLKKRFGESDPNYVQSQEFKTIIEKSRLKLNKNNLYLIAKEVTDELSLKKTLEIKTDKILEKNQRDTELKKEVSKDCTPRSKKRMKMIRKITKKLDKLGLKIKELEETEVDLSDEEESVYVRLQRHRDRYCQIYKKLCEYNNEASDAGRVFCRKICFNGSKYPAINKCIENWLNKTKRFPDFTEIMKLLESQATTLDLPSNKDSLRVTATEIFQQVGVMLQRRRKYDLWDSFCGFLGDQRDPAENDSELEKILKQNFDTRVKKEEEIFTYYAEKQEKERLQPEEVPDEVANCSPVESGSEDEKEIEKIEKSINERMDEKEMETHIRVNGAEDDVLKNKSNDEEDFSCPPDSNPTKETKNNYKNCKSVKWKKEKRLSSKNGNNVEDSAPRNVLLKDEETKDDLDLELIEEEPPKVIKKITPKTTALPPNSKMKALIPQNLPKSLSVTWKKGSSPKSYSRKIKNHTKDDPEILEIDSDDESTQNGKGVFQLQVQQNFLLDKLDFLDGSSDRRKKLGQGRVFRDLTNIGRLMKLNETKKRPLLLFSRFFHYQCFRKLEKPAWKRRSIVSNKMPGQKCALNYETTSEKNVDGGGSEEKETRNNSESGGDEGSSFSGGNKSGSDEDNNENDENKKRKGSGDEKEGEDEEENEEENEEEEESENNCQKLVPEEEENENSCQKSVPEEEENENSCQKSVSEEEENENSCQKSATEEEENENSCQKLVTEEEENENSCQKSVPEEEENENSCQKSVPEEEENENSCQKSVPGEEENENSCQKSVPEEEENENSCQKSVTEEDENENSCQKSVSGEDSKNENRLTEENVDEPMEAESKKSVENDTGETNPENEGEEMKEGDVKVKTEKDDVKKEVENEDLEKELENDDGNKEIENVEGNKEIENVDGNKETENVDENKDSKKEIENKNVRKESTKIEIKKEPEKEITKTEVKAENKLEVKKKLPVREKKVKETEVQHKSEIVTRRRSQAKEPPPPIKSFVTRSSSRNAIVEVDKGEVNGKNENRLTDKNPRVEKSSQKVDTQKGSNELIRVKKIMNINPKRDSQSKDSTPQPKNPVASSPATSPRVIDVESMVRNIKKRNNPNISTSDEERVKKFLLHSPSSISITPPRKMTTSKPPSQAALQALATLRNLKGISVRVPPKNEDDVVVIGESSKRQSDQSVQAQVKRRRNDLPVISNVQSIKTPTPKIVTVQGNASGFENANRFVRQNNGQSNSDSSSIRISNVWGGLTDSFYQSMQNSGVAPGCSFRQNKPSSSNVSKKKKNAKKTVEYVVLE